MSWYVDADGCSTEVGEIGCAALPAVAESSPDTAPWWLVIGIGVLVAAALVWAVWRAGGRR